MNEKEKNNGAASMDTIVLNQIQTMANRRVLHGMKSFHLDADTPDGMAEMLRRLERAESRRTRAAG